MLTPHPASAIEYWFVKVNAGRTALLVDWIERRKLKEHVLRVSIHSPYKREVIFEKLDSFMPSDNALSPKKTVGHAGDISWDLDIELGSEIIKPDIFPAGLLKMPDTLYESVPLARFTGWISHGPEKVSLDQVCGAVTQYWDRYVINPFAQTTEPLFRASWGLTPSASAEAEIFPLGSSQYTATVILKPSAVNGAISWDSQAIIVGNVAIGTQPHINFTTQQTSSNSITSTGTLSVGSETLGTVTVVGVQLNIP